MVVPTLATFRSTISNRLGLDNSTSGDQGFIDGWVNDGVNQLLLDTHCHVTTATLTGFDGATQDYTLDATVLEIVSVFPVGGNITYAMERVSIVDLLELRRYAPASQGPTLYYALQGANLLMFHPTPASGSTFTMYYVPVPTALSASADDPSSASLGGIPTAYHKAIEFYALSEAADANDDASSQQGAKYFQLYQDQVKKIRRSLRRRGGTLSQRAIVGPRGRRSNGRIYNDNSIY